MCVLNGSMQKSGRGLIGPDANKKKTGTAKHRLAGGGTISAEGGQYLLADYVRGGQFPLADYVRGDKICGGTESAPTAVMLEMMMYR